MIDHEVWTKLLIIVGGPVGLVAIIKASFAVWKSVGQTALQWEAIEELRRENEGQRLEITRLQADVKNQKERIDVHSAANVTDVVKGYTEMAKERLLPAIDKLTESVARFERSK